MQDNLTGTAKRLYHPDFECFKSNVCHLLKYLGDLDFIERILLDDTIGQFVKCQHGAWALYMLAMLDHISKENDIPLCTRYDHLRNEKLDHLAIPASIQIGIDLLGNEIILEKAYEQAIPEFLKYNILEGDIRNVC